MTYNSNNQGVPLPTKEDSPGYLAEYIESAALALEKLVVLRFTNSVARDAAMVGDDAPVLGQVCVLTDTMIYYKYNGTSWTKLVPTITVSTNEPSGGVSGDLWLKI